MSQYKEKMWGGVKNRAKEQYGNTRTSSVLHELGLSFQKFETGGLEQKIETGES